MIKIILVIIFIMTSFNGFACRGKIDPKKVVLFVDSNGSFKEVLAAQKAAYARCESFQIIPFGSIETTKKFGQLAESIGYYAAMSKKYCPSEKGESNKNQNASKCSRYNKELDKTRSKAEALKAKSNLNLDQVVFDKQIKSLAKDGVAVTSIIASGHDGGGTVRGDLQGVFKDWKITKHQMIRSVNDAYEGKDDLKNQLQSVFLWGCYTATPAEIIEWRKGIPSLNIIAGFHGSGPANWQKSSSGLLSELMSKESEMKSKKGEKEVKKMIDRIDDLHTTYSGLYLKESCGEEYYFNKEQKKTDGGVSNENFMRFEDAVNCKTESAIHTLKVLNEEVPKFKQQDEVIDQKTGKPYDRYVRLRELYNYARAHAMCIDKQSPIDPDSVGLLLFYSGVSENFNKIFGEEFNQLLKDASAEFARDGGKSHRFFDSILGFENGIANMSRSSLVDLLQQLDWFASQEKPYYNGESKVKTVPEAIRKRAKEMYNKVDRYLYKLDPDCMDFLEWHDSAEGHTPQTRCAEVVAPPRVVAPAKVKAVESPVVAPPIRERILQGNSNNQQNETPATVDELINYIRGQ